MPTRKRVFRVEFDPDSVTQLTDEQIRQLLRNTITKSVLGCYSFNVVKQIARRPTAKKESHGQSHEPTSGNETSTRDPNASTTIGPILRSESGAGS